jgi:hypothetical protein
MVKPSLLYIFLQNKCKVLTLCFTDNLMIFCKAEVASVSLVRNCLDQFWVDSGLSSNPVKSNMFFCGVSLIQKCSFLVFSGTGKETTG